MFFINYLYGKVKHCIHNSVAGKRYANVLTVNSARANLRLLSAIYLAKSFGFVFLFCNEAKSKRFRNLINIHKPSGKPSALFFIGFVGQSYFFQFAIPALCRCRTDISIYLGLENILCFLLLHSFSLSEIICLSNVFSVEAIRSIEDNNSSAKSE